MDFHTAQEQARNRTAWLVFLFILCVLGVVVAATLSAWGLWHLYGLLITWVERYDPIFANGMDPIISLKQLLVITAVATALVIMLECLSRWADLTDHSGERVAEMLGGQRLRPATKIPGTRRLLNVVDEMAIAAGIDPPKVYVLDSEPGINAFAAGLKVEDAVIGVSLGCLVHLNRDELQGVVAHEFSHILNGDMRLNTRLLIMVSGLLLLSLIGHIMTRGGPPGSDDELQAPFGVSWLNPLAFIVSASLKILGSAGAFFARLLQAAVSRQREFLADASAVEFTRQSAGIAGALRKIGGWKNGSGVWQPHSMKASHMFIAPPGVFRYGFSSHPPLAARIRALEPGWNGQFEECSGE